jgi:hypothetical protein
MTVFTNFETAIMRSLMIAVPSVQSAVSSPANAEDAADCNLSGFEGNVRVATAFGDLPIKSLRVGDEVRTISGRLARVQGIDKHHPNEDFFRKHPSAHPIRIPANAFGAGRPMQDMTVSPHQEICPDAHVATRFKTANEFCSQVRAQRVKSTDLTYYRFHCDDPVVVKADGVWVRVLP